MEASDVIIHQGMIIVSSIANSGHSTLFKAWQLEENGCSLIPHSTH